VHILLDSLLGYQIGDLELASRATKSNKRQRRLEATYRVGLDRESQSVQVSNRPSHEFCHGERRAPADLHHLLDPDQPDEVEYSGVTLLV